MRVSRQGSPHFRTVFWVQVKGNLSPMKYQAHWQEQWGEVTEPQGQEETLQTCMERTLGELWSMGQGLSFTKPVCTNVTLKGSTHLYLLL